ncbi:MAG: enhanced serine sensitivity protein SseB [Oscillospiraceae bacterium]|nr:enhanced serine sensitivity protein SseB [Oscillospiraceae bacterium]
MAEMKQSQQPITNPALVQAMDAMKQERNQKNEVTFVNHLKVSRFLVPANVESVQQAQANPDGTVELKEQPKVSFILFNNSEGEKYFPLFTDIAEIRKWEDMTKHQLAAISYRDLCQFFERTPEHNIAGAVVNPFGQNIMIPVESLLKIRNTEAIAPGTQIQIGTLKEEPTELLDVLKADFAEKEEINKAYLRVMKRDDKPAPNFLLVIDTDPTMDDPSIKALFDGIAATARPHLRNVELAIVPTGNRFGQAALRDAVPFYEKAGSSSSGITMTTNNTK